jgi:hypothetical protein
MGLIGSPEMSITVYQSTLRKIQKERRSREEGYVSFGYISVFVTGRERPQCVVLFVAGSVK